MTVRLRPCQTQDLPWVAAENIRFYRDVHGFDAGFAEAVGAALDRIDAGRAARESCHLVAEAEGAPVGCIFLGPEGRATGRIRLFYVKPAFRGRGLGRRMLDRVVAHGRAAGLSRILVSTYDRHPEACALYAASGFRGGPAVPVRAFGQNLRQIDFALDLGPQRGR